MVPLSMRGIGRWVRGEDHPTSIALVHPDLCDMRTVTHPAVISPRNHESTLEASIAPPLVNWWGRYVIPAWLVSVARANSWRPYYSRRSRQSQIPKAASTMKARILTQRGMLTSPALTSTRKRTRRSCARAINQRKIATTSDAGLLFIANPAPPLESESGEESTIPALAGCLPKVVGSNPTPQP